MIPNLYAGQQLTIDLDVFFDDYIKNPEEFPVDSKDRPNITIHHTRRQLSELIRHMEISGIKGEYRRSSSGNVHVRLTFDQDIYVLTVLDSFLIRAWLADDLMRLRLDMMRYVSTRSLHEINRCFSEKCVGGVSHSAGPWIPLEYDITTMSHNEPAVIDYRAFMVIRNRNEGQARLSI
jgi:hypothetical protein